MSKQETMFALIRQWERSGQSKAEFARRAGFSANVMGYWYRRYRQEASEHATPTFVQLAPDEPLPASPAARSERIRLELPDGLVVIVY